MSATRWLDAEAVQAMGMGGLGVSPARLGQRHAAVRNADGIACRLAAQIFGGDRDGDQQQSAHRRRPADQGVEQEADAEIERHPRQVEEGRRADGRHEGADAVEVMDRLEGRRRDGLERQLGREIEHPMAHRLVNRARDAHQHAAAHEVEQALEAKHHQRQDADGY
jgi:hypothetical protein